MNKEQLVDRVSERTGQTKKLTLELVDAALDTVTSSLKKGEKVTLVGFGTFEVRQRRAREGRNPRTGDRIRIPAKRIPAFTAGKDLKAAVKK